MKEDLIVLPDAEVFKSLVNDAKSDLAEMEIENDEEMSERRELALDIVSVLDDKLKKVNDLSTVDFKEKIWFAAHLYLLETVLEDLFEEEDEFFFEEEELLEADGEEEETER